jgi:orotidine-5'-phosphate decarboxylase
VSTPKQAIQNGSDYLVIGRPITASNNPAEALKNIYKEII